MILQVASGRPVYNLDLDMCGMADARQLLHRAAQESDILLLEGMMGLYDGTPSAADPSTIKGKEMPPNPYATRSLTV